MKLFRWLRYKIFGNQTCADCYRRGVWFHVPDSIWALVVPDQRVLCLSCWDRRAEKRGVDYRQWIEVQGRKSWLAGLEAFYKERPVTEIVGSPAVQAPVLLPWEFSEAPAPGEPTVPNVPTPEGRLLGAQLARLADIEEARLRERFPRLHPRCDDCALRLGTDPNGCPETLMDVVKGLVECVPFYCHKAFTPEGAPKRLCAGYAILAGSAAFAFDTADPSGSAPLSSSEASDG